MEDLIYLEPRNVYDAMILGISTQNDVIVYDADAILLHLTDQYTEKGVDREEAEQMAWDYFDYNIQGSYLGEHTPLYVSKHYAQILREA